MINWIKQIFSKKNDSDVNLSEEDFVPEREKPTPPPSKLIKENGKEVGPISHLDDLKKMKKPELLKYAKSRGIKANASLKKQEIIDKIVNA